MAKVKCVRPFYRKGKLITQGEELDLIGVELAELKTANFVIVVASPAPEVKIAEGTSVGEAQANADHLTGTGGGTGDLLDTGAGAALVRGPKRTKGE